MPSESLMIAVCCVLLFLLFSEAESQDRAALEIEIKFSFYDCLPWKLMGLASDSVEEAREAGRQALDLWALGCFADLVCHLSIHVF
jgi:hypothetical protein